MLRLSRVLKPYRGWPDPEAGSRWSIWIAAVENHETVKATTSTDDLYLDSYERYAGKRSSFFPLPSTVHFFPCFPASFVWQVVTPALFSRPSHLFDDTLWE